MSASVTAKLSRADLDKAIREAETALARFGVQDRFTVKIKPARKGEWIGMYRSRTQFHGHRLPIFWISEAAPRIAKATGWSLHRALVSTLLHEYGHVIYEWAKLESPALMQDIENITDDEEDFAETFGIAAMNGASSPAYRKIAARYFEEAS